MDHKGLFKTVTGGSNTERKAVSVVAVVRREKVRLATGQRAPKLVKARRWSPP